MAKRKREKEPIIHRARNPFPLARSPDEAEKVSSHSYQFPFMDLPTETRQLVYDMVIKRRIMPMHTANSGTHSNSTNRGGKNGEERVKSGKRPTSSSNAQTRPTLLALLSVSRQVHVEVIPVMRGREVFLLSTKLAAEFLQSRYLQRQLMPFAQQALRLNDEHSRAIYHIRHLTLALNSVEAVVLSSVGKIAHQADRKRLQAAISPLRLHSLTLRVEWTDQLPREDSTTGLAAEDILWIRACWEVGVEDATKELTMGLEFHGRSPAVRIIKVDGNDNELQDDVVPGHQRQEIERLKADMWGSSSQTDANHSVV